uniref:Uncharacterized protein n=1 Tax=Arundo donax TaxID=35708 RepID=A0A0A9HS58_ARUDO
MKNFSFDMDSGPPQKSAP